MTSACQGIMSNISAIYQHCNPQFRKVQQMISNLNTVPWKCHVYILGGLGVTLRFLTLPSSFISWKHWCVSRLFAAANENQKFGGVYNVRREETNFMKSTTTAAAALLHVGRLYMWASRSVARGRQSITIRVRHVLYARLSLCYE